jgi:hypothetical protein
VIEPIELTYDLRLLPRGRIAFRRWRYEVWHGPLLLAAGWRTGLLHAQRAVRSHAVLHAHRIHGLHPLRLEPPPGTETPWAGQTVAVQWGDLQVLLRPRAALDAAA